MNNSLRQPSKKARLSSARLYAVQGVYQMLASEQSAVTVIEDILYRRLKERDDDEEAGYLYGQGEVAEEFTGEQNLVKPNGLHLKKIITGVAETKDDLAAIIYSHYKAGEGRQGRQGEEGRNIAISQARPEGLLFSVLLCGAYELVALPGIDAPIIISDYINVGHAFFDRGETRLINGVLDKIAQTIR